MPRRDLAEPFRPPTRLNCMNPLVTALAASVGLVSQRPFLALSRAATTVVAVVLGAAVYWWLSPVSCGDSQPPVCERDYGGWLEAGLAVALAGFVGLLVLSVLERFERSV